MFLCIEPDVKSNLFVMPIADMSRKDSWYSIFNVCIEENRNPTAFTIYYSFSISDIIRASPISSFLEKGVKRAGSTNFQCSTRLSSVSQPSEDQMPKLHL